jgi:hypothetical protein
MKEKVETHSEEGLPNGCYTAALVFPIVLLGAYIVGDLYNTYYSDYRSIDPIECSEKGSLDTVELTIKEGEAFAVRKTPEDPKFLVKAITDGKFSIKTKNSVKILSEQVGVDDENIYLLPSTSIEIDIDGATYLITGLPRVNPGFNRISIKADCLD